MELLVEHEPLWMRFFLEATKEDVLISQIMAGHDIFATLNVGFIKSHTVLSLK